MTPAARVAATAGMVALITVLAVGLTLIRRHQARRRANELDAIEQFNEWYEHLAETGQTMRVVPDPRPRRDPAHPAGRQRPAR